MNEKEQTNSTDRKEDRTIVIVSVIGLLLSVVSFFGYYFINHFFDARLCVRNHSFWLDRLRIMIAAG